MNEPAPGFYHPLSDDLIHWTRKKMPMATDLAQNAGWQPHFPANPVLIGLDSASTIIYVTGQNPYLSYTRINAISPELDFGLVRIRTRIGKE